MAQAVGFRRLLCGPRPVRRRRRPLPGRLQAKI